MAILSRRLPLAALAALIMLMGSVLTASAAPAPAVGSGELRIFRNVLETGDLWAFYRISLADPAWTDPNGALVRLLDASTSPATVLQERVAPDVGETLTGFYLEPGHGIAWESLDLTAQVVSNPTAWDTLETASTVATVDDYIATTGLMLGSEENSRLACDELIVMLRAVEDASVTDAIASEDLVLAGRTTDLAREMSQHIMPTIAQVLNTCFTVGYTPSGIDFDPNPGVLDSSMQAAIEGTDSWQRFDALATAWGFSDASMLAVMLTIVTSVVAVLVAYAVSGSIQYGMGAGAVTLFGGSLMAPGPLLQGVFLVLAGLYLMLAMFWVQRVPR